MKRPLVLALWLILGAQAFADESIVVIANRNAPSEKINTDQAAQYFLKKQQVWPNGVQILGGQGVTRETVVARIFADMRAFRIYDGPSEVHRWSMARKIIDAAGKTA